MHFGCGADTRPSNGLLPFAPHLRQLDSKTLCASGFRGRNSKRSLFPLRPLPMPLRGGFQKLALSESLFRASMYVFMHAAMSGSDCNVSNKLSSNWRHAHNSISITFFGPLFQMSVIQRIIKKGRLLITGSCRSRHEHGWFFISVEG